MFYLMAGLLALFILSANYTRLYPTSLWRVGFSMGLYGTITTQVALWLEIVLGTVADNGGDVMPSWRIAYALYGALLIVVTLLTLSPAFRAQLSPYLGRLYKHEDVVHHSALVLMLLVSAYVPSLYIMVGGLEGVASMIADSSGEQQVLSRMEDMLILLITALMGIGTFIRRGWQSSLERLGVRLPIVEDWRWGIGVGIGLFMALIPISMLLELLLSPEALEAQQVASNEVFNAYSGSLLLGLIMAITAGIGEEVFFRGALQPVMGVLVTTVFFVLVHLQYTLTPASIIIFGVALIFAYLRERISTTSAIIAHTIYNAMPYLLFSLLM